MLRKTGFNAWRCYSWLRNPAVKETQMEVGIGGLRVIGTGEIGVTMIGGSDGGGRYGYCRGMALSEERGTQWPGMNGWELTTT